MATNQGKAKHISKGSRVSCRANKKQHPMSQKEFLRISALGGTNRVQNSQLAQAMMNAIISPKANQTTVKTLLSLFN